MSITLFAAMATDNITRAVRENPGARLSARTVATTSFIQLLISSSFRCVDGRRPANRDQRGGAPRSRSRGLKSEDVSADGSVNNTLGSMWWHFGARGATITFEQAATPRHGAADL